LENKGVRLVIVVSLLLLLVMALISVAKDILVELVHDRGSHHKTVIKHITKKKIQTNLVQLPHQVMN
jgi:hypothetical protein